MKKCIFSVLAVVAMFSATAQTQQDAIVKTMNERYEAASADFKTLIKATPTNGDLYFYAGENYLLWGELDSAQTMYSKGTEVAAINPLNFVGLGRVARLKGDEAKGELMFTKAVDVMCLKSNKVPKPIQQEAYIGMADSYTHVAPKNLDKALAHLTTATKFNPDNAELYIQLGDYYAEKDGFNLSNALSQYNKALEVNPKYTPALLRKGIRYVGFENYDEGLKYYNEAIASDPTFAPAYREKAELLYKAGRYASAVESYASYLELNTSCRVKQRYASFIFLTKDYKKAVEEIENVRGCNPDNGIMLRLLGYGYYELGDYAKSLDNLNQMFEMSAQKGLPTIVAEDIAYKGKSMIKQGQDSLGIEEIKKAIALNPKFVEGYGEVASAYSKQKKHALAMEWFQKKIAASEEKMPLDYYYLGQSAYFAKDYAVSDAAFAEASKKYNDAHFWRGKCNSKLDNADAPVGLAKPHYEEAIRLNGATPEGIAANKKNLIEAYSYLGFYYFTQKNFECSKAAWLKVQELDVENQKAIAAMTDKDLAAAVGTCVLIAEKAE